MCVEVEGSATCVCNAGWTGDGHTFALPAAVSAFVHPVAELTWWAHDGDAQSQIALNIADDAGTSVASFVRPRCEEDDTGSMNRSQFDLSGHAGGNLTLSVLPYSFAVFYPYLFVYDAG